MTYEITEPGIKYDWWVNKPADGEFTIFPVKGVHDRTDIVNAKLELRRDFDVTYIHVEWVTKEKNEEMLLPNHTVKAETELIDG